WFWLAVLVVTGSLWSITELSHSRADDDRQWEEKYTPRVHLWARQESQILRREGVAALERYIGSIQMDPGVLNYIFEIDGREVLGREASPSVLRLMHGMADWPPAQPRVDAAERIIAERIVDAGGVPHIFVVDYPSPSVLNRSVVEFLSAGRSGAGPDRAGLLRLAVVLAVAGAFCFMLAR